MHNKSRKIHDRILNDIKSRLSESLFYREKFLQSIDKCQSELGPRRKIEKIICYGLGSFNSSIDVVSRYQLALLLLIYEHLIASGNPVNEEIEVFDPSFDDLDKETLRYFSNPKFKLIDENEYCARELTQYGPTSTLVYMPHLDKYLYNNLLGSNWFDDKMKRLVILGNSFQEMIDNEIPSKCKSELYYINVLVTNFESDSKAIEQGLKRRRTLKKRKLIAGELQSKALVEFGIDDSVFEHGDIFNNLAFHSISEPWLEANPTKLNSTRVNNWKPSFQITNDDSDWPD